jgi:hypothetical protein
MSDCPIINWLEANEERSARWCSEKAMPPPKRVLVIDDRMTADVAYRLVCEGTALLWRGDFQNARQLLQALARRVDKKRQASQTKKTALSPAEIFHLSYMRGQVANEEK